MDRLIKPDLGYFLEIKSRTWSRRDADHKARVALDLIDFLGAASQETVAKDYLELIESDQE
jgi:5-methylthioadenosine/S-adenosylhomocysteine deaminase